jgi:tRNA G18 (ribose-2'-O)-methylase SpoU
MKQRTQKENIKLKGGLRKVKTSAKNDIVVVLDNIKSMYNVGAIFRTCECAKVKKIILCGITATPPRDKIYKTSMGTVDLVEWEYFHDTTQAIKKLKDDGYCIMALEQTDNSVHYKTVGYPKPLAIILGHEKNGISRKVLNMVDLAVEIPMYGQANSLNVATSAGIIIFEAISSIKPK